MNNYITTTKSSGFSLIELLVVVAILGVVAAIGTVSYSCYVSSTERKSAENLMRQVALGQTEYYTDNGTYYPTTAVTSPCSADSSTTTAVETNLLGGSNVVSGSDLGFNICVSNSSGDYKIEASNSDGCLITLNSAGVLTKGASCP